MSEGKIKGKKGSRKEETWWRRLSCSLNLRIGLGSGVGESAQLLRARRDWVMRSCCALPGNPPAWPPVRLSYVSLNLPNMMSSSLCPAFVSGEIREQVGAEKTLLPCTGLKPWPHFYVSCSCPRKVTAKWVVRLMLCCFFPLSCSDSHILYFCTTCLSVQFFTAALEFLPEAFPFFFSYFIWSWLKANLI